MEITHLVDIDGGPLLGDVDWKGRFLHVLIVDIDRDPTFVTIMASFGWGSSLTSIVVPDSPTTIRKFAFSDCSSLTIASIPSGATLGVNVFFNSPTTVTTRS